MKFMAELTQLLGAIAMIVGAWVINYGFGIFMLGGLVTAIGTLAERSMANGARKPDSDEG